MSIVKRTKGDYVITTLGPTTNVEIQTNTVRITGDLITLGNVDFPGADINANSITTTDIIANGNITAGGAVTAAGNVTAAVFIGDGSGLTGVPAGNALGNIISFGTSQVAVPQISGNVFVNVAGVSNVAVFSSTGANIAGNLRTGNILSGGFFFANGQPLTGSVKYDATPVAPVGPNPGDFWFNTVNGILYQYNDDGDTDQWVDSSGIGTPPSTTSVVANTVIQRDVNGSATANVWQGSSVLVTGNITTSGGSFIGTGASITGNIVTTGYFIGDGSQLSNIGESSISLGTSSVNIPISSGQVLFTVGGTPVLGVTSDGITNQLANGVGNIGNSTNYFNRLFATATTALYADLAENYETDQNYVTGTVLIFGGDQEVTASSVSHDPRVAGVVSTNPAYLMNSGGSGVAVALVGKVPCRAVGPISKGDLLVTSDLPGVAQRMQQWVPGAVLGKSLEELDTQQEKVINIVVGRH